MFHTDDYWEGNDYDCPDDLPDYLRDEVCESFHTDDYYGDEETQKKSLKNNYG